MSKEKNRFTQLFLAGAIILVGGLILKWYPESVIGGLEERLSDSSLSAIERQAFQNSLSQWKYMQTTAFFPLYSILLAIGIITIVYSLTQVAFFRTSDHRLHTGVGEEKEQEKAIPNERQKVYEVPGFSIEPTEAESPKTKTPVTANYALGLRAVGSIGIASGIVLLLTGSIAGLFFRDDYVGVYPFGWTQRTYPYAGYSFPLLIVGILALIVGIVTMTQKRRSMIARAS